MIKLLLGRLQIQLMLVKLMLLGMNYMEQLVIRELLEMLIRLLLLL
jgi:hypothetical protein